MSEHRQVIEAHHRGRALDCVHNTENFLDVFAIESICLFRAQQDFVKLFEKRICFKEVHIKHCFHTGFNFCHNLIPFRIRAEAFIF